MTCHMHYYRVTYLAAYEEPIPAMPPGPMYWKKVKLRDLLSPVMKVQSGRPKSKKRKHELRKETNFAAVLEGKKQKIKKQ